MSEIKTFLALVKQMRDMQREFFKTRSMTSLSESKELERRVDAEIERIVGRQRSLFERPVEGDDDA